MLEVCSSLTETRQTVIACLNETFDPALTSESRVSIKAADGFMNVSNSFVFISLDLRTKIKFLVQITESSG